MGSRSPLHLHVPDHPSYPSPTSLATTPEGGSPGAHRGRPSHWSPSNVRKLTRLYSYTDLQIPKIIQLIFKDSPNAHPSKESAQKKLKNLLDLENRWTRAKNDNDVVRRVRELTHSVARNRSPEVQNYAQNDPYRTGTSQFHGPYGFGSGRSRSSTIGTLALRTLGSQAQGEPEQGISRVLEAVHGHIINNLETHLSDHGPARTESWMSNASSQTTGSFTRLLPEKTAEARSAIKKLLKSYTMPPEESIVDQSSTNGPQLVGDPQASLPYELEEPKGLPSDFLYEDPPQGCSRNCRNDCHTCRSQHARHTLDESDWVTSHGFTLHARRILQNRVVPAADQLTLQDRFGNTILHFLAAQNINILCALVQRIQRHPMLNATNSASQTFMHILFGNLSPLLGLDQRNLCDLFNKFANAGVDLTVADCYGRTAFHLLVWGGLPRELMQELANQHGEEIMHRRDALGLHPLLELTKNPEEVQMDIDEQENAYMETSFNDIYSLPQQPISDLLVDLVPKAVRETQLKQHIDEALGSRRHNDIQEEDAAGRNSLHSLAMKTISQKSFPGGEETPAFADAFYSTQEKDSSASVLDFRLQMLKALLANKVDPNHYDYHGVTPLMMFAAYLPQDGDYKIPEAIIQTLLDAGANIEARNRAGETALLIATRVGNKLTMKALTENHANVHATDSEGRGVLQIVDAKMRSRNAETPGSYAKYELCRAYLSGLEAQAVQRPSVIDEWQI